MRPRPAVANPPPKRRVLPSPSRRARPLFTQLRHRSRSVFLQGFNSKGGLWKTFLRQENVPKSSREQSSCCGRGARAGCIGRQGQRAGGRGAWDGGLHAEESTAQKAVRSREKRRRHAARGAGTERARLAAVSPSPGSREEHVRTSPMPPSRRKSRGSAAAPRQRSSTAEVAEKSVATPPEEERESGRASPPSPHRKVSVSRRMQW